MRALPRILGCLASAWLAACADHAPPPSSVAPAVLPAPSAVEPPPSTAPVASSVPGRVEPPRRSADVVRQGRVRLAEARRAAHAGDAAGAWAMFAELIEASPRSPQLRCEGGYVAQRAGRTELAEEHLDAGLGMLGPPDAIPAALRLTAATCLYNRGLVYEARHAPGEAARVYRASLALRPNAVVQRHLDALPPDPSARAIDLSTAAALARSLAASACDTDVCDPDDDDCHGEAEALSETAAGSWLRLTCPGPDPEGSTTDVLFALRGPTGLRVFDAATAWDGGRYYGASSLGAIDASAVTTLGEGEARWTRAMLTMTTGFEQEFMEISPPEDVETTIECYASTGSTTIERTLVLCHGTCRALVVSDDRQTAPEAVECSDDGESAAVPSWARAEPDAPSAPSYEVSVEVGELGAQLRVVGGTPPSGLSALIGRLVPLDELFAAMTPLRGFPSVEGDP